MMSSEVKIRKDVIRSRGYILSKESHASRLAGYSVTSPIRPFRRTTDHIWRLIVNIISRLLMTFPLSSFPFIPWTITPLFYERIPICVCQTLGVDFGLWLTINIEQYENVQGYADEAGVLVSISTRSKEAIIEMGKLQWQELSRILRIPRSAISKSVAWETRSARFIDRMTFTIQFCHIVQLLHGINVILRLFRLTVCIKSNANQRC
jgi:hypothetical protein